MSKETENNLFDFDLSGLESLSQFMEDKQEPTVEVEKVEDLKNLETKEEEIEETKPSEEVKEEELENKETEVEEDKVLLTPYAKLLVEEGILPDLDLSNFDGTTESLVKAQQEFLQNAVNAEIENYKKSLDPRVKWLQDNYEEGVPLEELLKLDKDKIELSSINEEELSSDINLQKQILRNFYKKTTRFSDSNIEKEINRIDNSGELEEVAKSYLGELLELTKEEEQQLQEESKTRSQQERQLQEEAIKTLQKTVNEIKEIIPGVAVNENIKKEIYKTLITPTDYDQYGNPINEISKARAENPIDFEVKLAYLWKVTKGFTDWNTIVKGGKKEAFKEFEKAASAFDSSSGRYNTKRSTAKDDDYINNLREYNNYLSKL